MNFPDQPLPIWGSNLRIALEFAATLAFALSGVIEAARKRLDAVGVCVLAFAAAFGGGTLRDLLLDQRPFFWVRHIEFLWATLALCVLAMFFMRQRHLQLTERAILWPDAIGLGLFTAVGVDLSMSLQQPALIGVLMGVTTSVFGGVLRDILCNEIPRALGDHRPYALWAFVGGWLHVLMLTFGIPAWIALTVTVSVTAGLRMLSVRYGWQLPVWRS
ncbi:trimeric intracellular cation channel family protein [Ottowia thiooxydans]|uniref:trimeric intracellular cation channel family protein n=1 Tax=Ottowia thiooxydans TaxID=219182 RepID=UPI00042551B9|nr:trimeric intracellular cation channel family protein [Ottowia thiooxydans]